MDRLIALALRRRIVVVVFSLALLVAGALALQKLSVDAFPDVTNVQVVIATRVPGSAPEDVERLVTIPLEIVMTGLPGLLEVRSVNRNALSQITLVFTDATEVYDARQMVLERLESIEDRLPAGVVPVLGPVTTALSEVYQYLLERPDDGGRVLTSKELTERRTIQDWVVRPLLRGIAGVAEINSIGGFQRQYQILLDPERLRYFGLTAKEVYEAVALNNDNSGGGVLPYYEEQYLVRGVGLIRSIEDIGNIVLKESEGTPVFVRDVATVQVGRAVRFGAAIKNGYTEAVGGLVLMQAGANAKAVVTRVKHRVDEINQGALIPGGLEIVPFYDRSELVDAALWTVTEVLIAGVILVTLILLLFLGDLRSSLIVVSTLLLTPLITFLVMKEVGLSANLMSLGGMAIAIGMMVDGSVVVVENVFRHLSEDQDSGEGRIALVQRAAAEVATPVVFGVGVICLVFLPLMTLQGMEGKLFAPLAYVIAIAMFVSLVVSLTLSPALCAYLLKGKPQQETRIVALIRRPYVVLLRFALANPIATVGMALGLLVASGVLFPFLGTSFIPELREGSLVPGIIRVPNMSLEESVKLEMSAMRRIAKVPGVALLVSNLGRGGDPSDPQPEFESSPVATLKPMDELPEGWTQDDVAEAMREALKDLPGAKLVMAQPISDRVDEMVAGVKADLAIKLFGEDLTVLRKTAEEIADVVRTVDGARDVRVEQVSGQQYLTITVDRNAIARFGVNVEDINDMIEAAIGGRKATEIFEGERRFDAVVRFPKRFRDSPEAIGRIQLRAPGGAYVPLADLAQIQVVEGPVQVSREARRRRIFIAANVRGRDLGGFVADVQATVKEKVPLPEGYFVQWGGQFKSLERATRHLALIVPVTIAGIFFLLFLFFDSGRYATLIMLVIPFASIGGIFGLFLFGEFLSVPASVGFITLGGIVVLNGVVLVSFIQDLRRNGMEQHQAIVEGCIDRLRPVLMTATTSMLGLAPFLVATGPGSEVQRPLAVVVIGGLFTSTLLTLVVLPVLYSWFEDDDDFDEPRKSENGGTGEPGSGGQGDGGTRGQGEAANSAPGGVAR